MDNNKQQTTGISGRILIEGEIQCATGLHIGGGKDNMAIGVVDMTVVRDPLTRRPLIPGSSIKGKMRSLLAKTHFDNSNFEGLKIENDPPEIKRLFGATKPNILQSRLQFCDAIMTKESVDELEASDTDLYLSEVKYENTIDRITSGAIPRQIERVPAGSRFTFKLTYVIEDNISRNEMKEDISNLKDCFIMLQQDYLGGHGSRGSGRIVFKDLKHSIHTYGQKDLSSLNETIISGFDEILAEIKSSSFFDALLVGV